MGLARRQSAGRARPWRLTQSGFKPHPRAMRILHILDHSIPLHSGYTFRTLSILKAQRALGWETFHLTTPKHVGDSAAEETIDGWHFFRTRASLARPPFAALQELSLMRCVEKRLLQVVDRVKPDVLHAHSPVLNAIPALRVGKKRGLPVVYEVRAFWEDAAVDHGTTWEGSPRYRLTRALETWALKRVNHVTTICEGLRADIVARGISAGKVTVIPNAVDVSSFSMSGKPDEVLKASLGLAGKTVAGFIGSFYAYEGLDLLIAALPIVLKRLPDFRLLLVGGGPQEMALKSQATALGLADEVVFAGRVPHNEVQLYYDLMDVLVYPRHSMRLTELVTPLKPLEAMAQGRLLVASDVGGHRELIRDGHTGFMFRAGDVPGLAKVIERVLASSEERGRVRLAGRKFVETERTWAGSVSHYAGVYSAALAMTEARR
jgi:PEP-CTERM/exosortase A-associated glycosyltransferase